MSQPLFTAGLILTLTSTVSLSAADTVFMAGNAGKVRFTCVFPLSDGSLIVGGAADDLDWLPASSRDVLVATGVPAADISDPRQKHRAFLLHLSGDGRDVRHIWTLPTDVGGTITAIKTDSVPGATTGNLYISGLWTNTTNDTKSHAWIGKLNANGLSAVPTAMSWVWKDIANGGGAGDLLPPWDVGGDGKVVFSWYKDPGAGAWRTIIRLKADGSGPDTVANWVDHGGIFASSISLKPGTGDWRSTTSGDYNLVTPDGHGGTGKKKGRFPYDFYYSAALPDGSDGGYTGYSSDGKASTTVAIAVDRRSNAMYVGFNNGNPQNTHDFEPMVVAMTPAGAITWYSHLYTVWDDTNNNGVVDSGETAQCPPDQYVDDLTIDYSKPVSTPEIVVLARAHGNAPRNFWSGTNSFHNGFTGTNGNEHMGWIGRLRGDTGVFINATWHAEYDPFKTNFGAAYSDPNLDSWPNHNLGWASLKTTQSRRALSCDLAGNVYVVSTGRGPVTTANAFQKSSNPALGKKGCWADYARVYKADFSTLLYSSIWSTPWNDTTGDGGGAVNLLGVAALADGLVTVGYATAVGMPTSNTSGWATSTIGGGEAAVIGRVSFAGAGGSTGGGTTGGGSSTGTTTSGGTTGGLTASGSTSAGSTTSGTTTSGSTTAGSSTGATTGIPSSEGGGGSCGLGGGFALTVLLGWLRLRLRRAD